MAISRLVCSGGGAKGVLYTGAYEALEKARVIEGVEDVAGASAGAINAALIAIGMSSSDYRALLLKTNLFALKGARITGSFITRDGQPLLDLMNAEINKTTLKFLEEKTLSDKAKKIKQKLAHSNASLTFEDLVTLRRYYPLVPFPFNSDRLA